MTAPSNQQDGSTLPPVVATVLSSMLPRYYRTFFPDAVGTWFFSKTRGRTPDQPIHRNFPSSRFAVNPMDVSSVPGSMIIATMDDTIINGYGWNHQVAFQSKRTEIKLQMGDILFIRGDFIHSQTGYAYNNLCVQAFMVALPPGNPWRRAQLVPLYEDEPRRDEDSFRC
ncbi:hypothetical protein V7S43_002964 [Phytophthora oleae]|uniref:Uncharacterized protein n=1 Tax=Phytophthora oleae TaxID=2107226 RepID=A0ABD3G0Y6_9STRA